LGEHQRASGDCHLNRSSPLQATVAEKHGRRAVLVVSLAGTALTCLMFGTATSLMQAICIRLLQGVFAGSVGVARGSVAFITDPSNEGRAYAILGYVFHLAVTSLMCSCSRQVLLGLWRCGWCNRRWFMYVETPSSSLHAS
jgi:MFS family permease